METYRVGHYIGTAWEFIWQIGTSGDLLHRDLASNLVVALRCADPGGDWKLLCGIWPGGPWNEVPLDPPPALVIAEQVKGQLQRMEDEERRLYDRMAEAVGIGPSSTGADADAIVARAKGLYDFRAAVAGLLGVTADDKTMIEMLRHLKEAAHRSQPVG